VVKLYVVRHANAGSRSDWDGPDRLRPLSEKGRLQAEGIAKELADQDVRLLVSSPSVRCVQTLEPLGARGLALPVVVDDRLDEGSGGKEALELVLEMRVPVAAICSHGDVIPDLLDALRVQDTKHHGPMQWAKASTWELKLDGDRAVKARYRPPPDRHG
jgi:8-oxo-dGTP diphosphatase